MKRDNINMCMKINMMNMWDTRTADNYFIVRMDKRWPHNLRCSNK